MGFWFDLGKCLFTLSTSLVDVSSDIVQSLDFMGYKISTSIINEITGENNFSDTINNSSLVMEHKGNITTVEEEYRVDEIWGILGLSIIFLPGIVTGVPLLVGMVFDRQWKVALFAILLIFTFPVTLVILQLIVIVRLCQNSEIDQDLKMSRTQAIGAEAFFEGFCQLLLQMFSLLYGYSITKIQIVTIIASFFQIARMSIILDIENNIYSADHSLQMTFTNTLVETLKRLPCYISTIMFRLSAFGLTIAFLREWSIIPIVILFIELAILSCRRNKDKIEEIGQALIEIIYTCVSNMSVMNAYPFMSFQHNEQDAKSFLRNSSVVTFLHHSVMLIIIMMLAVYNPTYFDHWSWPEFQLKPDECHFYWVFGCTWLMGCYSLTVTLYRAKNIVEIETESRFNEIV